MLNGSDIISYLEWLPDSSSNTLRNKYLSLLKMHKNMSSHVIEWLTNEKVCVMHDSSQKLLEDF